MFPVSLHLSYDPVGSNHPADQDTGQKWDKWHQKTVADIIHNIQELSDRTIWKFQFEIQFIIPKADQHCRNKRIYSDHAAHFFTWFMRKLHAVCNQSFHNRYTGGQCRKSHHQEKQDCHRTAEDSHGFKYLWQRDKDQAWPGSHSIVSKEHKDSRDDHHSCKKCNSGIKNFNLICRLIQIHFILYIRTIGDHNSHRYT